LNKVPGESLFFFDFEKEDGNFQYFINWVWWMVRQLAAEGIMSDLGVYHKCIVNIIREWPVFKTGLAG
jgi:hypothetical protein